MTSPNQNKTMIKTLSLAAISLGFMGLALGGCSKSSSASDEDMTMGPDSAKTVLTEYASVACPHCAEFNEKIFPEIKTKYIDSGKIKYVYKEMLTGQPELASAGALLARCVSKDKYFKVNDAIMRALPQFRQTADFRGVLLNIAKSSGLSEDQFNTCVSDEKGLTRLNTNAEKYSKDGIDSTPTFFINGKRFSGNFTDKAEVEKFIDQEMK